METIIKKEIIRRVKTTSQTILSSALAQCKLRGTLFYSHSGRYSSQIFSFLLQQSAVDEALAYSHLSRVSSRLYYMLGF